MHMNPDTNMARSSRPVVLIGDRDGRLADNLRVQGTPSCSLSIANPETAGSPPAEASLAVLCDPTLSRDMVMRWVHWAMGQGREVLVPEESLPVLRRVGLAPQCWHGHPFYRFRVPAPRGTPGGSFGARFLAWLAMPPALVLMGALALGVRLKDGTPVFFRQRRRGRHGRVFVLCKFRSMRMSPPEDSPERVAPSTHPERLRHEMRHAIKRRRDAMRTTSMGRFMRRVGLDELPQLFHLLRGEMTWIGPRPLPLEDLEDVEATGPHAWVFRRENITPGLTGLYQVCPRRRELGLHDMCVLDLYYLCNRNLRLDLWILVRTLPAMMRGWGGERDY